MGRRYDSTPQRARTAHIEDFRAENDPLHLQRLKADSRPPPASPLSLNPCRQIRFSAATGRLRLQTPSTAETHIPMMASKLRLRADRLNHFQAVTLFARQKPVRTPFRKQAEQWKWTSAQAQAILG
jgi:hypothetical protein